MTTARSDERAAALAAVLPVGAMDERQAGPCVIVDITARGEGVLVRFRWRRYPYLLGCVVGYDDPDVSGDGFGSMQDWVWSARDWLVEELATGLVMRASRLVQRDFIELVAPDLPHDARFSGETVDPEERSAWNALELVEQDGFDTSSVRELHAQNRLLKWVRLSVNGRWGSPCVGHAAVVEDGPGAAMLVFCDVAAGVPATVPAELCLVASHFAAWEGARTVVTEMEDPVLDVLGFVRSGDRRVLSTELAAVDPVALRQLAVDSRRWRLPRSMRRRWPRRWYSYAGV